MHVAKAAPRSELSARVIHADGSITDLGIISRKGHPVRWSWLKTIIERMKNHGK